MVNCTNGHKFFPPLHTGPCSLLLPCLNLAELLALTKQDICLKALDILSCCWESRSHHQVLKTKLAPWVIETPDLLAPQPGSRHVSEAMQVSSR